MSEMVERVALVITDCEAAGPITLSAARVVARNVIEAMREPTAKMSEAAYEAMGASDNIAAWAMQGWMKERAWPAMIDEALK